MKIKIRPHDPDMLREPDWRQMNGWLAEIRDDGGPRPAGDDRGQPAPGGDPRPAVMAEPERMAEPETLPDAMTWPAPTAEPEAAAWPAPMAEPEATAEPEAAAWPVPMAEPEAAPEPEATPEPEAAPEPARAEAPDHATSPMRAVIGDELRIPIMWCEMGSCISWCTDPSALGEADARARAISAGWRIDALGRLACPRCQQTDPRFWATRQVVRWDRYTAVARAAYACGEGTVSQPAPPYPRRWS